MTTTSETYCAACGYDLRGLSSERCPECGLAVDSTTGGLIPWERRKDLGRFTSLVRTLGIATFNPNRIGRAAASPVDLRSAKLFRWIVILLAMIPLLGTFFLAIRHEKGTVFLSAFHEPSFYSVIGKWNQPNGEPFFLWSAASTFWPTLPIGLSLTLFLGTNIAHWFCLPGLNKVRQNRAMVISFYLTAPLTWTIVPLSIPMLALAFTRNDDELSPVTSAILGIGPVFTTITSGVIVLAILVNLRAIRAATQSGIGRMLFIMGGVMVQWLIAFLIGFVVFPLIVGLVLIAVQSVRG